MRHTSGVSDDDATEQGSEDTTVLHRGRFSPEADEPTVVQPAVDVQKRPAGATTSTAVSSNAATFNTASSGASSPGGWSPAAEPTPAASRAPANYPTPPAYPVPSSGPLPPAQPSAVQTPRRRPVPGQEYVRLPYRRPWTSVVAGVLALVIAGEALYELFHNWSGQHSVHESGSRFAVAYFQLEHSGVALTTTMANLILGSHYHPGTHLDARIALASYGILWLIVGLLLLLARGSGIVLGLAWCGAVGLAAAARGRVAIDGFGLHTWPQLAAVGASFAPLALVILIAGLGGSRRARLHSTRPAEPDFVDVNEPGQVWHP